MHETGIAFSTTVPACQYAFEIVEPDEQALDFPAALVATQDAIVLGNGAFAVPLVWRNHFNVLFGQPLIDRIAVVDNPAWCFPLCPPFFFILG